MKKFLSILLSVLMIVSCVSTTAFAAVDTKASDGKSKLGDVNADGKISIVDARWVLQYCAGTRELDDVQFDAADVTIDNKISILDARWILQVVAGIREIVDDSEPEEPAVDPNGEEMKALAEAIDAAKAVNTDAYTEESVDAFNDSIADAEALLGKDDVTASQINEAIENMDVAKAALKPDNSALKQEVKDAYSKDTTGYTIDSVDAYYNTVAEAEKVLADKNATAEQIAEAVDSIKEAEANLTVDKALLADAISKAEAVEVDGMLPETVTAFEEALENARKINASSTATPAEVAAAANALEQAMSALVVDKTGLDNKISEAETLDKTGYTADSVTALNEAIDAAKAVKDNADAQPADVKAATDALEQAMADLKADTTALDSALAEAKGAELTGYTEETKAALEAAIADAEAITGDNTPEEVAAAKEALEAAVAGLKADTTDLETSLAEAKGTELTGYTADSAAALEAAIADAEAITGDNTPEEVAAAKEALEAAVAGLKADLTELNETIAQATAINQANYTEESAKALADAITAAQAITDADKPEEVAAAKEALQQAIDGLDPKKADTTELEAKIAEANALNMADYTDETAKALTDAITAAQNDVIANPVATTEQVAQAITDIDNAMAALVTLDSALADKVAEANAIKDAGGYTADSVAALETAINSAEAATTPEAKKQAIADIENAINNLEVDKTELANAISQAESADKTGMTPDSIEALNAAIDAAKAVNNDANASADEVKAATDELKAAIDALELDKTALNERIESANGIDTTGMTASSVENLANAIAAAEAVRDDANATLADINNAIEKVNEAVRNLEDEFFDTVKYDKDGNEIENPWAVIDW